MIFSNPSGAPELACDQCGCRWFDRMTDTCYECGAPVTPENMAEIEAALAAFSVGEAGQSATNVQPPAASHRRGEPTPPSS